MADKILITIGRELGSGGREIGRRLAKDLDIPFYDKEIINEAARKSGFAQEVLEKNDEKPTNSFLFALHADMDFRIKNTAERHGISEKEAEGMCLRSDKDRAAYYDYYSNHEWGDGRYYDLVINTSRVGIDKAVEMIKLGV